MPAFGSEKEIPLRHHLVTIVRGLVFGGAIEFQEGVGLDFPDFMAAEFAFDGSDGVLSTDNTEQQKENCSVRSVRPLLSLRSAIAYPSP
jgi:hypothetical protein